MPTACLRAYRLLATLIATIGVLLLAACGPVSRGTEDILQAHPIVLDHPEQTVRYRFVAGDPASYERFRREWELDMVRTGQDGVTALALSGGGSGGAYGAGVLVGWSQAGRPAFNLVTGVSTGAMIAPFVFAGPAWDAALQQAFLAPELESLTTSGLGIIGRPSIYSGIPLSRLVLRHATPELLTAIAERHRAGARLLVATTNIDTLETAVWNMGEIAVAAQDPTDGEHAARLFRSVIVASASVPAFFPPVTIRHAGRTEVHVDGGVNAPLLLVPEAAVTRVKTGPLRPLRLYVVVNGRIDTDTAPVHGGTLAVVGRSLTSMGRASLRAHLQIIQLFAQRHRASFDVASVTDGIDVVPLAFDSARMRSLFEVGLQTARAGTAFAPHP